MNYHKITHFDTSNGVGIRTVLWVSGCAHKCEGCHNPQTWDFSSGVAFTDESLDDLIKGLDKPYIDGVTFSGGDPLSPSNLDKITDIAKFLKDKFPNKSIWCYTGYTWENVKQLPIMKYLDVLVDGRFMLDKRNLMLPYCGSENQRVLDVEKSLVSDQPIVWNNV